MFGVEEPPAKVLTVNNEDAADATDASNLSEGSAPDAMDFPDTTELPTDVNLPESMGIAESLSMDGTEMVEERLQDSFESQEPPGSQESQEEWLNEEVLTDDDFNPAAENADSQASQTDNSQSEASPLHNDITEPEQIVPDVMEPEQKEPVQGEPEQTEPVEMKSEQNGLVQTEPVQIEPVKIEPAKIESIKMEPEQTEQTKKEHTDHRAIEMEVPNQNIEDALNTLEGGPEKDMDLPDLDGFLIRKIDVKADAETKNEINKQEEDDGNDTDDLLRMLGEDGSKTKKLTKTVKDIRNSTKAEPPSSDDDDFVFEGSSAKKLKLAKSLVKKVPLKAEPEDDDADQSSDEGSTMKKMFNANNTHQNSTKQDIKLVPYKETHVKNIVSVKERPKKDKVTTSTPLRASRSILRPPRPAPATAPLQPSVQVKKESHPITYSRQKPKVETKTTAAPAIVKTTSILKASVKQEPTNEPEVIAEEEHEDIRMAEEEFESEFEDESSKRRQRIMKPERMDEDVPSDVESHSEDGSLYDELPSSDSEDADDWFQVDIRAEKAGDYLPLMGSKAREVLLEEKQRVASRIINLKQSLGALTDSGKKQAEQVRTATMALAELDDMLKAS